VARRDVVVVGASAGGVEALRELVGRLPVDFPACILVVLHVPPSGSSALPRILGRATPLRVKHAEEGERLERGTVLIAPPDRHLIVYDRAVTLSRGPKENGHRPAVDVLFRSAAATMGSRVVGVILSGALDDGAAGMVALKLRGGLGMVQDPEEALHPSMPRAAIAVTEMDHVLPVGKIADMLTQVVGEEAPDDAPTTPLMHMEAAMADLNLDALTDPERPGEPSGWTCPDCHGSLVEIREGGLSRFRCRVGHAWSPDSLVAQQTASLETALWVALRTLEEKASLTLDLGRRAAEGGHRLSGEQFERLSEEARRSAQVLRTVIENVSDSDKLPRPVEASEAD
jgi:two-component system, chemotaxis family, protein-glutamate methylesterase/glutaminase